MRNTEPPEWYAESCTTNEERIAFRNDAESYMKKIRTARVSGGSSCYSLLSGGKISPPKSLQIVLRR